MEKTDEKHDFIDDDEKPSQEITTVGRHVADPEDPAAPSKDVSSKKQSLSDLFTIFCAGAALISDGYQNSLM